LLYATDLGNDQAGPQRPGVSAAELAALQEAGIRGPELVRTLTDAWPMRMIAALASFVPGLPPADERALPDWLATARVVPAEELVAR
jgi:hypothetical protein